MWNKRQNVSSPSVNTHSYGLIKKVAITTILGLGITLNVVHADDINLSSIYHVYIDGKHIGTVDSKETIQSYIDKIIEDKEKENQDLTFTVGEEIKYISEKVFNTANVSNQEVIDVLDNELTVKVDAYELKIGDRLIGYFKNKEAAEETLKQYKAKYIDIKTLEELESKQPSDTPVEKMALMAKTKEKEESTLAIGDTKTLDVQLSEKVSLSEQKVSANDILTEEEAKTLLEKGTLEEKVHKVEAGEVLGQIASKYNLELDDLLKINPDLKEDSILQIGQEINVTDYEPILDVIVKQEKLVEEDIAFEKEVKNSDELYKGETKVEQEGQDGIKKVHYAIEKVNGDVVSKEVLSSDVIKEPVKEIIIQGTKVIPSRGTGQFKWPTYGGRITSKQGHRWGRLHKGIDIAGVSNRTIMAADNGVVVEAGYDGGFGNKVVISHNNGYKTIYAHMSSISVSVGQSVPKGTKIGVMGSTGNSTGVHLHFEVYKNGSLLNPLGLF